MSRKINPTGVRIPPDLRQALDKAAKRNGRSLNSEILDRLKKSFGSTYLLQEDADEGGVEEAVAPKYGGENINLVMDAISLVDDLLAQEGATMSQEEKADFIGIIVELLEQYGGKAAVRERIQNIVQLAPYLKKTS